MILVALSHADRALEKRSRPARIAGKEAARAVSFEIGFVDDVNVRSDHTVRTSADRPGNGRCERR